MPGHDFEFAAVDDFTREAVVAIHTDQTSTTAAAFLEHVVATLPYQIEAVLTDNAFAFTMRHAFHATRLTRFQQVCAAHGIRHYLLRPYKPQSNGKVERFFRTINDECLYVQPLFTFAARVRADCCGGAMLRSAATTTSGRSTSVGRPRVDARAVTGLLHK